MSYWIGVLLATIGASLILGALTFVSALIGVVVNAMIVLMCGPIIDGIANKRGRGPHPVAGVRRRPGSGDSGVVAARMAAS